MDIRDELDAMLNNLKNGAPPAQKKSADKKQVSARTSVGSTYDKMSVDELVSALSTENKPQPKPAEKAEKSDPVQNRVGGNDGKIPDSLLFMLSKGDIPSSAPRVRVKRKNADKTVPASAAVIEDKADEIQALPEKENETAENIDTPASEELLSEPEENVWQEDLTGETAPDTADIIPEADEEENITIDDVPSDEIPIPESSGDIDPAASIIAEAVSEIGSAAEETAEDGENEDDSHAEEKEEAPLPKKSFFSRIKSVFSNKKEEDGEEASPDSESDDEAEISEAAEEEAPDVEELDTEPETADSSDENSAETFDDETESEEADDAEAASAIELIDAALAAIEEENDEEPAESEKEEIKEESDSADMLIADIREDAASAIAEIESREASDNETESEVPETDDDETEADDSDNIEIDVELKDEKKKGRITAALEQILNEEPDALVEERSEKPEKDEIEVPIVKNKGGKAKRRILAVCGVIFTLLAAVGLASSIRFGINHFRSFTQGETKKDGFTDIIYPAVIMDISSFAQPEELPSDQIITAAIWSLVMSDDDMAKYERTFDVISVPAVDVEAYAAKLFGDKLPAFEHGTVGTGDLKFYYNEETKSYNVPVQPISFTYEPDVKSVAKNGSEYVVTVDYIKEVPAWMKKDGEYEGEVSKTVEFRLTEKNDGYIITSMTLINVSSSL